MRNPANASEFSPAFRLLFRDYAIDSPARNTSMGPLNRPLVPAVGANSPPTPPSINGLNSPDRNTEFLS